MKGGSPASGTRFVLLAILLVPLALAHEASYDFWTVVDDDGTAADVVKAANFAAAMKASEGMSFTGKTLSQARAEFYDHDADDLFVVLIDESSATVMADYGTFSQLFSSAQAALGDLEVTFVGDDFSRLDLERRSEGLLELREDPQPVSGQDPAPRAAPEGPQEGPTALPPADSPQERAPAGEGGSPEQGGLIGRIWRWFAGLFS